MCTLWFILLPVLRFHVQRHFIVHLKLIWFFHAQLLLNLRQSVATLDICGEWGSNEEATLEMQSGAVYVQGRAPQNRLSALQVPILPPPLSTYSRTNLM